MPHTKLLRGGHFELAVGGDIGELRLRLVGRLGRSGGQPDGGDCGTGEGDYGSDRQSEAEAVEVRGAGGVQQCRAGLPADVLGDDDGAAERVAAGAAAELGSAEVVEPIEPV